MNRTLPSVPVGVGRDHAVRNAAEYGRVSEAAFFQAPLHLKAVDGDLDRHDEISDVKWFQNISVG
jgi:hypothetical protein